MKSPLVLEGKVVRNDPKNEDRPGVNAFAVKFKRTKYLWLEIYCDQDYLSDLVPDFAVDQRLSMQQFIIQDSK